MKYIFFVLTILLFISCDNRTINKKHISSRDSLALAIQGVWGGYDTPAWDIGPDSIFYYSENKSYYYFIHGNDIIVLYKNGPYTLKNIQMVKDTFFCSIGDLNVKFFRSENNKLIKQSLDHDKNISKNEILIDTAEVKKGILGEWGYQHSKGIFSWIFTKDSINYIQRHKTFFYRQIENNVIVLTDKEPILMKDIIIRGDTMYFTTEDSIFIKAHKIH